MQKYTGEIGLIGILCNDNDTDDEDGQHKSWVWHNLCDSAELKMDVNMYLSKNS